jgi:two-component system cell cycle response regulator DivK
LCLRPGWKGKPDFRRLEKLHDLDGLQLRASHDKTWILTDLQWNFRILMRCASCTDSPDMARCIIVDDHGDTRAGYAEFLSAFGFEVRTAADADELRGVLQDWQPDAIVLDLQLPRTDGWELTREIKSDPRTRQIAIVVVSACVLPAERAAAEEAGCDAFINKPCDPMWIVDELRRQTTASQG